MIELSTDDGSSEAVTVAGLFHGLVVTPMTPNVDYSAYPKSRSWVFGINLSF